MSMLKSPSHSTKYLEYLKMFLSQYKFTLQVAAKEVQTKAGEIYYVAADIAADSEHVVDDKHISLVDREKTTHTQFSISASFLVEKVKAIFVH